MKRLLLFSVLLFSFFAFGQKVKFKKGVVLIDDKEVFHYEEATGNLIIYTLNDKDLVSIVHNEYEEKNPAHFNGNNPYAYRFPAYIKKYFSTVKFLKGGKEMNTELSDKELIIKLYRGDLIDENGNLNNENVDIFINKYSNQNLEYKLLN